MTSFGRISRAAGTIGLLAVGALVLHELSYLIAFGGSAGVQLEHTGHGYLDVLAPLVVAAAVATLIVSVVVPALLRLRPAPDGGRCLTDRAAAYAAALVVVHLAQEGAEGILHPGHAGLAEVLGAGGVVVLPLAMALGALGALVRGWLDRAERRLVAALERRRSLPRAPRALGRRGARCSNGATPAARCLAFGLARRPPPPVLPVAA